METDWLARHYGLGKSTITLIVSREEMTSLENTKDKERGTQAVLISAAGLQGEEPLVDGRM